MKCQYWHGKEFTMDNEKTKEMINAYLVNNVISNFSEIPTAIKLSYVQETPKKFIHQREINKGNTIPYIDHFYAERALNFISNFNWGAERIHSEIIEVKKQTRNGIKTMYDALVELKMWIEFDGKRIERYIVSGHNAYENPATTRADALKSAVSKANTVFAKQFGIGANIVAEEQSAYDRVEKHYVDIEVENTVTSISDEDFKKFLSNSIAHIQKYKSKYAFTKAQKDQLDIKLSTK